MRLQFFLNCSDPTANEYISMRRILSPLFILALFFTGICQAGTKKGPDFTIRLHGEADKNEGESFVAEIQLTNSPEKIFIHKVPEVNERDIRAFFPFPGNDGMIGAYFQLDAHGTNKLQQFTVENKGRMAVILINGRVASKARITNNVNDGILFVPGGILPVEIARLHKKFPIIGKESEFRKKPKPIQ